METLYQPTAYATPRRGSTFTCITAGLRRGLTPPHVQGVPLPACGRPPPVPPGAPDGHRSRRRSTGRLPLFPARGPVVPTIIAGSAARVLSMRWPVRGNRAMTYSRVDRRETQARATRAGGALPKGGSSLFGASSGGVGDPDQGGALVSLAPADSSTGFPCGVWR